MFCLEQVGETLFLVRFSEQSSECGFADVASDKDNLLAEQRKGDSEVGSILLVLPLTQEGNLHANDNISS